MSTPLAPLQAQTQVEQRQEQPADKRSKGGSASVQLKAELGGKAYVEQTAILAPPGPWATVGATTDALQAKGPMDGTDAVHAAASHGVQGGGGALPHVGSIQAAFGGHDVSGISAHVGGQAAEASQAMGATAYASGNDVAFASQPDLHTAAHEAAHIVQQRSGVSLEGGVGKAGDSYENHADKVADAVVAGQSAEPILNQMSGGAKGEGVQRKAVQQAGGAGAAARDVRTEAVSDAVAKQKVADVDAETAPNCAGLKATFFSAVNARMNADAALTPLAAMRAEVAAKQGTYLLQGAELPTGQIAAASGLTRILDLPGLHNNGYLKPSIKSLYPDADAFVAGAQAGRFDPDQDLDNRRNLRGRVNQTWWAEAGSTAGLNLVDMIEAFHLTGDPSYPKGAVQLTVTASGVDEMGLKVHKPTAFDGMQQGWGSDPWWVASGDRNWGLTKHGTKEVVMGAARLSCFGDRRLVLPPGGP